MASKCKGITTILRAEGNSWPKVLAQELQQQWWDMHFLDIGARGPLDKIVALWRTLHDCKRGLTSALNTGGLIAIGGPGTHSSRFWGYDCWMNTLVDNIDQ